MSKVLGFIPCRSGSKRIKNKNLLTFNSKSLIQNVYDFAELSKSIDDIVVSTDSSDYLNSFSKKGKFIDIGLRSKKNSTDKSTDIDVLKEVIQKLKIKGFDYKYVIHLRPTYPAISEKNIDDAYKLLLLNERATSLKSVEKLDLFYQKCLIEDDEDSSRLIGLDNDIFNISSSMPSQKCKNIYAQTAALDIYKIENILSGNLWGSYCLKYEFGNVNADIDEYFDLPHAYSALDQLDVFNNKKKGKQYEICFDIDGLLFSRTSDGNYSNAIPNKGAIEILSKLKNKGFVIILQTARGTKTGKNWFEVTKKQLENNNVPYDKLIFKKPGSDFYVDDRFISLRRLKKIFNI